jgi:hypothetical protein
MIIYPTTHRELQEAIDKATHFLLEAKKVGTGYGGALTEKHLENLYKIQVALMGRIEASK